MVVTLTDEVVEKIHPMTDPAPNEAPPLDRLPVVVVEPHDSCLLRGVVDHAGFHAAYPDLTLRDPLQVWRRRGVYKAHSDKFGSCIVKTSTQIETLRLEYTRLQLCADMPHIVTPVAWYENVGACLYAAMVMPDVGLDLDQWIDRQQRTTAAAAEGGGFIRDYTLLLKLGIQLATALDGLHRNARLIHSDLSRTNVCIREHSRNDFQLTLIDLGAAHGFHEPFHTVTPAFQSPEQARGSTSTTSVDHRSDLYALGVLLFSMATGKLPISTASGDNNYAQFRRAVLTQEPKTMGHFRLDVPVMFERMVARLLHKQPDQRYATAASLKYDLEQLLQILLQGTKNSHETTFELGTHEVPFTLILPNQLIGRQVELAVLDRLYETALVAQHSTTLGYIQGKPGVGKSSLVAAFYAQRRNPFFLTYKFSQLAVRPMHAMVQILSDLAKQIVSSEWYQNETIQHAYLNQLRECDLMRSVVDLVPAFATMLPTTAPIPKALQNVQSSTAKVLFPAIEHVLRTTRQFICNYNNNNYNEAPQTQQPIVWFLDDVQWIDPATKDVISYVLAQKVPFLIIIAFRDATSQNTFTIQSILDSPTNGDASMTLQPVELFLHEFTLAQVEEFVHHLALPNEEKTILSRFLFDETGGNQFHIRFRLNMMAETGALQYHADQRCWRLDQELFNVGVQVQRQDVVEYCIQMLQALETYVTSVLCRIAMMPRGGSIAQYASLLEQEPGMLALAKQQGCSALQVIQDAVQVAVRKNILYHQKGFSFAHDRLQQCALQCVSDQEVAGLHFYMGCRGLEHMDTSRLEEAFDVLQHFYEARQLVTDPELILKISKLAVEASSFYVTAGSQAELDNILEFVRGLLQSLPPDQYSEDVSPLEVRLLIAHHQIKYLMNQVQAAEELFNLLQSRLISKADIRDAYFSRVTLLANSDSNLAALQASTQCLDRLGVQLLPPDLVLPEGEPANIVMQVKQKIQAFYTENPNLNAERLANLLPVSQDEEYNFQIEMLISTIASAYVEGRFDLYMYIPSMAVSQILEHGLTHSAGHAFSVLGFALCAVIGDNFGAEIAMLGNYVVERFDNPICTCRALCLSGISVVFDKRYQHLASRHLYRSYAAGRTAHDLLWACYSVFLLALMLIFEGIPLPEIVATLEDLYAYAMSDGHQLMAQSGCRIVLHTARMLMKGNAAEPPIFHFSLLDNETSKAIPLIEFAHGATAIVCLYFENKLQVAWQLASQMLERILVESAPGLPPRYTYTLYTAVVAHGLLSEAMSQEEGNDPTPMHETQRDKLIDVLKASSATLDQLNTMAPIFTPFARIARACISNVVDGQPLEALKLLDSVKEFVFAEWKGKHIDLVAIANLEAARICRQLQLKSMHRAYMSDAVLALEKWGARHVATYYRKQQLDSFPEIIEEKDSAPGTGSISTTRWNNSSEKIPNHSSAFVRLQSTKEHSTSTPSIPCNQDALDFASILSCASDITSFANFEELCEKLSTTLLKHSTASRLLLFLRQGGTDNLEPTSMCTAEEVSLSSIELVQARYSHSIVRVTDKLKESVVVNAAQDESPYCFESYVQEAGVQSIASLPIIYQESVIAVVYFEQNVLKGSFTPEIMASLTLLGQHVASAIVNARLVRDVRTQSAQLEQSHAFLAKALRVKETILSNTSHEFRTPLNGIIGLNQDILSSGIVLHPDVRLCAETTLSMSKQRLALVSDILDLSKLDHHSPTLNYETVYLRPIIEEIFSLSRGSFQNVTLVNNVADGFEVSVDPGRLKQVLLNLVENGQKFSPDGTVTVAAEISEDETVFAISVQDTGIGIEEGQLDTIFDPFVQVVSYETRNHEGTGLGLSIAKRLVDLHGGRIDVTSQVGVGSTFQVLVPTTPPGAVEIFDEYKHPDISRSHQTMMSSTSTLALQKSVPLPEDFPKGQNITPTPPTALVLEQRTLPLLAKSATQENGKSLVGSSDDLTMVMGSKSKNPTQKGTRPVARQATKEAIQKTPLRVLAVDDTPINLKIICNILSKADMKVTTAVSGKELLEKLAGVQWREFDVILLDWMMPEMDGITACRLLRERIPPALLPVLFLTAKTDSDALGKGFEVGATDYITKPFNRIETVARTRCQGTLSRHSRAHYFDAIPAAPHIISREPFWRMEEAHGNREMFIVCFQAGSRNGKIEKGDHQFDGPMLLRYFQSLHYFYPDWDFYELAEDGATFLVPQTTVDEIHSLIREILAFWADSLVEKSTSYLLKPADFLKPSIRVGVDYRSIRAHLIGDRPPMLAAIESCASTAQGLARQASMHEEILISDSAAQCFAAQDLEGQ